MTPTMYLMLGVPGLLGALVVLAYALDLTPAVRVSTHRRLTPGTQQVSAKKVKAAKRTGLSVDRPQLGLRRWIIAPGNLRKMEQNLTLAGKDPSLLPSLVLAKLVAPLSWAFVGWTLASRIGGPGIWIVVIVGLAIAYAAPDVYISGRAVERQAALERSLPDVLDQITVALDAGMSFEAAFARVGVTHRGALGPEILHTTQDMAVGVPRREAYTHLAERNNVPDLKRFIKSLIQAEEFGIPLSQVVRLQADEMRDKRRQKAAALAKTVPLKLLFPMLTTLLPVLFIIMLTPAIMQLGEVL